MLTMTEIRPSYGHAQSLLIRCRCGEGWVTALLDDGTPVCAACSLEKEKEE